MSQSNPTSSRIYYMDYMRLFIIFLVIVLHGLLPFVIGYDWITNETKSVPFGIIPTIIDVFIMPIMFFIAGYFAFPSIRKGVKNFVLNKVFRIAIPFFIGIVFFAPILSYIRGINHGIINASYITYLTHQYFNNTIEPAHYWFLSILFFLFIIFSIIYLLFKNQLENIYEKSQLKSVNKTTMLLFLLVFFIISILLFYVTGRKYFDGLWFYGFKFISFQYTRLTLYILYFLMGIVVFIKRIRFSEKFLKFSPLFIILSIISSLFFIKFKFEIYYYNMAFLKANIQFYNAIIHVMYCFFMFITLMLFFKKHFNKPSKLWKSLADNSYTIYFVHLVYQAIIQYYLVNVHISSLNKFLIATIITLLLSIITGAIISKILTLFTITNRKYIPQNEPLNIAK